MENLIYLVKILKNYYSYWSLQKNLTLKKKQRDYWITSKFYMIIENRLKRKEICIYFFEICSSFELLMQKLYIDYSNWLDPDSGSCNKLLQVNTSYNDGCNYILYVWRK